MKNDNFKIYSVENSYAMVQQEKRIVRAAKGE